MSDRDRDERRPNPKPADPGLTGWSPEEVDYDLPGGTDPEGYSDLPDWSRQAPPRGGRKARTSSGPTDSGARGSGYGQLPELSRTLGSRPPGRTEPYARPAPTYPPEETGEDWWEGAADWQPDATPDPPPARRRQSRSQGIDRRAAVGRVGVGAPRARQPRGVPAIAVPTAISQAPFLRDRVLLASVGLSTASLLLMAAVVGNRIGQMPEVVALHLNAAGVPDLWGTREALWRLPLATAMLSIMNVIAGALLHSRDAFVARFLVASSLLVNVLAWIAVALIFW